MINNIKIIKPEVDREHQYAVGVGIKGGGFTPIQSYGTEEQLERGFNQWYQFACQRGITKPIAVEKEEREHEWDGARCFCFERINGKSD